MPPPRIDAAWVEWAVATHVSRYSSPRGHVERLLRVRVRKAERQGAEVPADLDLWLRETLDKHVRLGTIDDAAWAENRARGLTRRGVSRSGVGQRLRERGIANPAAALTVIAGELAAAAGPDEEAVSPDLIAACAWARRRRFGPFARSAGGADAAKKALAAMGRAGFSWGVSKRVLEMELQEAERLLERLR